MAVQGYVVLTRSCSAKDVPWSLIELVYFSELFEEGRRNCSFSHARMGPIQDLI
jgi:hypothetical protein